VAETQQELMRRLREQAWHEGYDACREGKQRFRNPYRLPSESDEALDRKNLG